jgi:hypothetical protein
MSSHELAATWGGGGASACEACETSAAQSAAILQTDLMDILVNAYQ